MERKIQPYTYSDIFSPAIRYEVSEDGEYLRRTKETSGESFIENYFLPEFDPMPEKIVVNGRRLLYWALLSAAATLYLAWRAWSGQRWYVALLAAIALGGTIWRFADYFRGRICVYRFFSLFRDSNFAICLKRDGDPEGEAFVRRLQSHLARIFVMRRPDLSSIAEQDSAKLQLSELLESQILDREQAAMLNRYWELAGGNAEKTAGIGFGAIEEDH